MDQTTVSLVLNDIMAACEAAFGQDGAPAIPPKRWISHGPLPIAEGDQLTVTCVGISSVHPFPLQGLRSVRSNVQPSAGITIEIWRTCWPTPSGTVAQKQLPNPKKLTPAALDLAADASCLFGYLIRQITAGTLCPSLPLIGQADDFAITPMVPTGPQGAYAGWRWPIAVKLTTT